MRYGADVEPREHLACSGFFHQLFDFGHSRTGVADHRVLFTHGFEVHLRACGGAQPRRQFDPAPGERAPEPVDRHEGPAAFERARRRRGHRGTDRLDPVSDRGRASGDPPGHGAQTTRPLTESTAEGRETLNPCTFDMTRAGIWAEQRQILFDPPGDNRAARGSPDGVIGATTAR